MNLSEIWKPIPGLPCYEASDLGRVRSTLLRIRHRSGYYLRHGRVLTPRGPSGRRLHLIISCGHRNTHYVHDLVARAFHGPKPKGAYVLHLDDNPQNNVPQNLRYGTQSENEKAKHIKIFIPDDAPF